MKKCIYLFFVSISVVLLSSGNLRAQELTVDEIVEKANLTSYYAGNDGRSDIKMTITDAQGRERVREFRVLRMNIEKGGKQKFYVYFKSPSDVAKMVFMVWKHLGANDDRWLYLPALDLVRRIDASDKRSSFVGSHFVYEDVSGRGITEDSHELLEVTEKYYKIKNIPKDIRTVEFASYDVWIERGSFMPTKIEYYNENGDLIKSIEVLELEDIQGHPTVVKSIARDFVRGGQTINEFNNVVYDIGLTEDLFEERYLRRAPVKWIK